MSKGIIVSPANRGVQVVVTDENNVQLLVDSNRGVNLEIVPQPRIEVLVDKGVEGAQGPVGPQGPQGPQGTAATVTAGTTTTGAAGTNAIVTNSGTSSAAVFDFTIPRGDTGATGAGVATGGTTGQVLVKASNANYDTTWATITGTLVYQGSWNASTNTPTLTSSVGTNGYYYVVGTSGSTNLNGITDWVVGDWAIFNGSVWQKIDNTDLVSSVNGQTGVVVLDAADVGALSTLTSTDGSVTITSPNATTRDLSVAISGSTTNVVCLVRNTTGATLTKGTVVYISGATGQNPTVSKAIATGDATSAQTLGMMTADLPNNTNGYVTIIGLITNIDTSAYTDGEQLYLSGTVAGAVTGTKPFAPIHLVYVAVVEYAHPTQGKLFVKVQNGYELDEIHDVSIVSPTTGQTLVYNATNDLWENSNAPVIIGTTINNTVIGGTTPAAGTFTTLTATGQTSLGGVAGAESIRVLTPVAAAGLRLQVGVPGSTVVRLGPAGASVADFRILAPTFTNFYTGSSSDGLTDGALQARIAHTASAVNYVQVTGAATGAGNYTTISSQGSDSAVNLRLSVKGTGTLDAQVNSTTRWKVNSDGSVDSGISASGGISFKAAATGSQVNYLQSAGGVASSSPILSAQGSDTNIAQVFQSKGTGAIDLAAGSSGVNISNGGTVTALTRTAVGSGYTTIPSLAISAPTTAGGVQATATAQMYTYAATVQSGGTGYTLNDVLTVSGGTPNGSAATYTVTGVTGGVVTAVTVLLASSYTALPTNPASTTGGTGTGCTLNLLYSLHSSFTITNAGSGYVEQPTVSFSGGGGSGAAAYATVGSGTTVRSLGATLDLFNSAGTLARFSSTSAPIVSYPEFTSSQFNTVAYYGVNGTGSNIGIQISSKGTGSVTFQTSNATQFNIVNTASAVNYVQVTGAATGSAARISTQGSDSLVGLGISSKGGGDIFFQTNGSSNTGFIVKGSTTAVNYIQVAGTSTGFGPVLSAQGSDTNIPVVVQPKGTGALQAQQTDSTATGGNARGANAVDWQTTRNIAAQVASGTYAFIGGGGGNAASGFNATVAGGNSNVASNNYAFVGGGLSNNAGLGMSGIVAGYGNQAVGYLNFVGGGYANSATTGTAVTTQSATMNGTTAVTLSGSNANIKVGQLIIGTSINSFPYTYVAAISGTSLTLSQVASGSSTSTLTFYTPHGVVVGGGNNQATGSYSFIGGGGDAGTAANRNVASGDWSFVGGGRANNIQSGSTGSVIAGGGDYGGGASGNTISSAASTISGGFANTITAYGSVIVGGAANTANGQYSVVLGSYAATTRSIQGNVVIGSNAAFSGTQGTTQLGIIALNSQTTDATATVLRSNTSAASTTNQVILPNNSAYTFRGEIVSGVTGGGNSKSWTIEGLIKRGANAASTTLVGSTVTSMYADVGAATWTIALSADTTNGGLAVTFTGQVGTTIRTVAQIRTTEMTF